MNRQCKHPFKRWVSALTLTLDLLECIDCGTQFTRKGNRPPQEAI